MANETELSNYITIGNAVSAMISPAFVNQSIMMNLVHAENFPENTNVIKLRKDGSLTAETLAESTAYTPSSSSELTEASVTLTAAKGVVATKLSVEAMRFAGGSANLAGLAAKHGQALGRLFDTSAFALFTSSSNGVTASTTLTKDNLLDAIYNVFSSMKGAATGGRLAAVLHYKGVNEVRKELTSISASAFSNVELLNLVRNAGVSAPNSGHLAGEFAGMEVYQTSGLGTSGGDNIQVVFHPEIAFGAGFGGTFETTIQQPQASTGYLWEISSYMFYDVKAWNNTAACKVLSDS